MEVTALDYNDLPNIPREMRRALFKRYLAKLGGLGMYDPASLEKVQGRLDGFQSWLFLPLSLATKHLQSRLIQQEEEPALKASLWFLTRDRRIHAKNRINFARWTKILRHNSMYDKKRRRKKHRLDIETRKAKIFIKRNKL